MRRFFRCVLISILPVLPVNLVLPVLPGMPGRTQEACEAYEAYEADEGCEVALDWSLAGNEAGALPYSRRQIRMDGICGSDPGDRGEKQPSLNILVVFSFLGFAHCRSFRLWRTTNLPEEMWRGRLRLSLHWLWPANGKSDLGLVLLGSSFCPAPGTAWRGQEGFGQGTHR